MSFANLFPHLAAQVGVAEAPVVVHVGPEDLQNPVGPTITTQTIEEIPLPQPTLDQLARQHRVDQPGEAPPQTEAAFQEWLAKLKPITQLAELSKTWKPYDDQILVAPAFEMDALGRLVALDRADGSTRTVIVNAGSKAEKQLAGRFNLPMALPEKLRALDAHDELARIFDKASRRDEKEILFRSNDDGAFAALSSSYLRMDNRTILGPTLEKLDPDTWGARELNFGDPSFSSWDMIHRGSARIVGGDRLMIALAGMNSEDGGGRLRFSLKILRLACLNGLIIPMQSFVSADLVHRGSRLDEAALAMQDLPLKILDMVPDEEGVFSQAANAIDLIARAQDDTLGGYDQDHLAYGIASWTGLTMGERNKFMEAKSDKYQKDTVWAWTNSLTELAKSDDHRRNSELQTKSWEFLRAAVGSDSFGYVQSEKGREIYQRELAKVK